MEEEDVWGKCGDAIVLRRRKRVLSQDLGSSIYILHLSTYLHVVSDVGSQDMCWSFDKNTWVVRWLWKEQAGI